jgi:uncharacterized protein (TIGR00251 family)
MDQAIQADSGGVTLRVKVTPRSSKNGVAGLVEGAIKITLTAPPVEGAANEMLVETLAKLLHLHKSDISIISGQTSRLKRVRLAGVSLEEVRKALNL